MNIKDKNKNRNKKDPLTDEGCFDHEYILWPKPSLETSVVSLSHPVLSPVLRDTVRESYKQNHLLVKNPLLA